MKQIIFLIPVIFCSGNIIAQTGTKKTDTTVIRNTDIYSNFKTNKQSYPIAVTIPLDTAGKVPMVSLSYIELTNQAEDLFKNGQFDKALNLYIAAFKINNDRGQVKHRYNAACCLVKLNNIDAAFTQLFRIAEKGNYYNYKEIESDQYFQSIQKDPRWTKLIKIIKENASKITNDLNATIPQKE